MYLVLQRKLYSYRDFTVRLVFNYGKKKYLSVLVRKEVAQYNTVCQYTFKLTETKSQYK